MEFDPYSETYFNDPTEVYRWMRDEAPVYFSERYGFWALTRYDDVLRAHLDWQTLSNAYRGVGALPEDEKPERASLMPGWILGIDPPDHDRMRTLVNRAFAPKMAQRFEPIVRGVIGDIVDELSDRDTFDIVAEFAALFPCRVISRILGVPAEDAENIRHWTDALLRREEGDASGGERAAAAIQSLYEFFLELAAVKRADPDDDMISHLCTAEMTADGEVTTLDDAEVAGFAALLGAAGSETVTKLVGNAAVLFAQHRDQWDMIVEDRTLIPAAVEEINRFLPPSQYQNRYSLASSTYHGVEIPPHHPVLLITGAATRDPRAYDEPDAFRIDRTQMRALSFGHGIHLCVGAHLARLESRIAIETFIEAWPDYDVDLDRCRRVQMSNVAGYDSVPVSV